jgi:putative tryptophan/tyrosine transport system substrate-binding protein
MTTDTACASADAALDSSARQPYRPRMRRRDFLKTTVAGILAAPLAAGAQAGRMWRIGYLSLLAGELDQHKRWIAAFRDGLRELGYVEGDNVIIEQRYAAGRVERLPALAAELVGLNVDILVAAPAGSAFAAKNVTSTVPIVFMGEPDPIGTGLVTSFARPGGNATGLADAHTDLVPKRLELLKQLVPSASRIGVLWSPSNASTAPQLNIVRAAAPAVGLTIVPVEVKGPGRDHLDRAFATLDKERLAGLLIISDPTLGNHRTRIAELAIGHRLPTSGTHRGWAESGLLMSYGTDFVALFRHGAGVVDKILKGAAPGALPVERPTKFELSLNTKTAKALRLTIPPSLLARADQVIE